MATGVVPGVIVVEPVVVAGSVSSNVIIAVSKVAEVGKVIVMRFSVAAFLP